METDNPREAHKQSIKSSATNYTVVFTMVKTESIDRVHVYTLVLNSSKENGVYGTVDVIFILVVATHLNELTCLV